MSIVRLVPACVLLLAACYWGPRVARFPAATTPQGATVVVQTPQLGRWSGELVAAEDSGLVVVGGTRLLFVPYTLVRSGHVVGAGPEYALPHGQAPSPERLQRLRRVSRFPQGTGNGLLARLLGVHQQASVEVAR